MDDNVVLSITFGAIVPPAQELQIFDLIAATTRDRDNMVDCKVRSLITFWLGANVSFSYIQHRKF